MPTVLIFQRIELRHHNFFLLFFSSLTKSSFLRNKMQTARALPPPAAQVAVRVKTRAMAKLVVATKRAHDYDDDDDDSIEQKNKVSRRTASREAQLEARKEANEFAIAAGFFDNVDGSFKREELTELEREILWEMFANEF